MDIGYFLKLMTEKNASDMFLTTGAPVYIKIEGKLYPLGNTGLPPGMVKKIAYSLMDEGQVPQFERELELNMAIALPDAGRFRVNVFKQRGEVGMVIRAIRSRIPSIEELNLPQAGCTASGIAAVAALPKLRSLRIGGPYLQGTAVCDAVVSLEKLRFLHLVEVEIGDAGLAVLEQRPDLWSLYLDRAGVSDEAWGRYFQACPNVHVHVDQAHHDRDPGGDREQHETRSPIAPGASVQQQ